MPTLPPGPYQSLPCPDAPPRPFYVLPFDKRGICEAPATRTHLLEEAATGRYTDIFVFSHGWNNDWPGAVKSYRHFIDGFMAMVRKPRKLALPAHFRPLYWSASTGRAQRSPLAMRRRPAWPRRRTRRATWPSPRKPTAARPGGGAPCADAARFYALLQQSTPQRGGGAGTGAAGRSTLHRADDELADDALTAESVAATWSALAEPCGSKPFGEFGAAGGGIARPRRRRRDRAISRPAPGSCAG
jgi:hypothetical protein